LAPLSFFVRTGSFLAGAFFSSLEATGWAASFGVGVGAAFVSSF